MKFAALALVGTSAAINISNQEKLFANSVVQDIVDENGIEKIEDYSLIELNADKILEKQGGWEFRASHHGFPGTVNEHGDFMSPYTRQIPERFIGDAAQDLDHSIDKFTQNMLNNYAIEGKDDETGIPTGKFWVTKADARKVAGEVICTHFKRCGADAAAWLDSDDHNNNDGIGTRFDVAWSYYDVNKQGRLDAIGMIANFMRHMFRPLGQLDLQ